MILQNNSLPIPQSFCDSLPFFSIQNHPAKIIIYGMTLVEAECILRHHIQGLSEDRVGFSSDAVSVTCCVDVWSGFVDLLYMIYGL